MTRLQLSLVLAITAVCGSPAAASAATPQRPNIVFILADDHTSQAISCYGGNLTKTPNIDRIAQSGMRFDRCFCTESICGPSRAAIMTGKYGHVTGAMGWKPYDRQHRTFPEYLQAAGYQTALVGKYHLGLNPPGFDEYQILPGQGVYLNPKLISKEGTRGHEGHVSDVVTDVALTWLDRLDRARPFLLCLHHKATHMPWQPAARHAGLFAGQSFPEPPTLFDGYEGRAECVRSSILKIGNLGRWQQGIWGDVPDGLKPAAAVGWQYQQYLRYYLQTAAGMDENIGRVLDHLDQRGLSQNTVVIYSSDQGFFLGEHGWFDKRWMLEESLRMPLVVRYPPLVKPGTVAKAMVLNVDFAPTLLDLAGVKIPADMQGRSLRPLLSGSTPADWRTAIYYRYYAEEYGLPPQEGVRTERYKLIHYQGRVADDDGTRTPSVKKGRAVDQWELFDLDTDPDERVNLCGQSNRRGTIDELKARLESLRRELKAGP